MSHSLTQLARNGAFALSLSLAHADPPTISISVTEPRIDEYGLKPGAFVFTRSGPTDAELYFAIKLVGTSCDGPEYIAEPGKDYSVNLITILDAEPDASGICFSDILGAMVIPAGASAVALQVIPQTDREGEPEEEVLIELLDNGGVGYAIAGDPLARFTLTDRGYESWSQLRIADSDLRLPDADADDDGETNLYEYALLSDPSDPSSIGSVHLGLIDVGDSRFLGATFTRLQQSDSLLTFTLEQRQTDGSWLAITTQERESAPHEDGTETAVYYAPEILDTSIDTSLFRLTIAYSAEPNPYEAAN